MQSRNYTIVVEGCIYTEVECVVASWEGWAGLHRRLVSRIHIPDFLSGEHAMFRSNLSLQLSRTSLYDTSNTPSGREANRFSPAALAFPRHNRQNIIYFVKPINSKDVYYPSLIKREISHGSHHKP